MSDESSSHTHVFLLRIGPRNTDVSFTHLVSYNALFWCQTVTEGYLWCVINAKPLLHVCTGLIYYYTYNYNVGWKTA